jgi:signal transduction histidine kinase
MTAAVALNEPETFVSVAEARRDTVLMRIGLAGVLFVFCILFSGQVWAPAAWFAAVIATQFADRAAIIALLSAPSDVRPMRSNILTATTTLSAIVWSLAFLFLWTQGGTYGKVVATLSCAGSMLHVAVVCHHSPRLFWMMISPYAFMLVGPMVIASIVAGDIPVLAGVGLLLAVCGFIGNFFASYKQLRNMTQRVESARAEAEARRIEADTANAAKSDFLATMSHELRTPLNAVIGYSEMLEEELGGDGREGGADDARRIRRAGRHLLTLINDILDLSKIEAGRFEVHPGRVNVANVVDEAVSTMTPAFQTNGNRLIVQCDGGIGDIVSDEVLVKQCLLNLLSNANKFTSGGEVRLNARRVGDVVSFEVADTGIGMTEEQVGKLFQAFVQADASMTRKYGGTGLGLAITRRLARLLMGDVRVTSAPGAGSVFTLTVAVDATPQALAA